MADEVTHAMHAMMTRLKLTVNEEKADLRKVPGASLDPLGYTCRRCYDGKSIRQDVAVPSVSGPANVGC
jgi:hypothetical protein